MADSADDRNLTSKIALATISSLNAQRSSILPTSADNNDVDEFEAVKSLIALSYLRSGTFPWTLDRIQNQMEN